MNTDRTPKTAATAIITIVLPRTAVAPAPVTRVRTGVAAKPCRKVLIFARIAQFLIHVEAAVKRHAFRLLAPATKRRSIGVSLVNARQGFLVAKA
jgi:hypothetical protein